jgi:hypothetical protein
MMIYQPKYEHLHRVVWYGGESTQLHFEKKVAGEWKDIDVRTLGSGLPDGVKQLYEEMRDYLDYCITQDYDSLIGTIF